MVNELPKLNKNKPPLGQYLKAAKLLSDIQIEQILTEQKTTKMRFGEIARQPVARVSRVERTVEGAIAKGWLKPVTIEFFLEAFSQR